MPIFVHAVNTYNGLNMDYGFVLKIADNAILMRYWLDKGQFDKRQSDFAIEFDHDVRSSIFRDVPSDVVKNKAIDLLIQRWEAKNNKLDFARGMAKLTSDSMRGMSKALNLYGTIYIQKNGGYFVASDSIVIRKTIEQETFDYPNVDKTIRLLQWGNGKHWYAKIGHLDVVDTNGNQKWDTKEEAQKQAEIFLTQRGGN